MQLSSAAVSAVGWSYLLWYLEVQPGIAAHTSMVISVIQPCSSNDLFTKPSSHLLELHHKYQKLPAARLHLAIQRMFDSMISQFACCPLIWRTVKLSALLQCYFWRSQPLWSPDHTSDCQVFSLLLCTTMINLPTLTCQ